MKSLTVEWDDRKAASNLLKHKISFDEAKTVFFDDNARIIEDPDHSIGEERFIILGLSFKANLLIVCHCYRKKSSNIRIISARKATRYEAKQYRGFLI